MSYIRYIKAESSPVLEAWSVDDQSAYQQLDTVGRCGFMLEQSVIMRYLFLAYGGALPTPLRHYAKKVQERVSRLIKECENLDLTDSLYIRCANMADSCKKLLNGDPITDPITVKEFLRFSYGSGAAYPRVYSQENNTFYDAFLSYLCPEARRSGFKVTSGCSLPSLSPVGHVVNVGFDATFTGYVMNQKVQSVMASCGVMPNTMLEFLAGYQQGAEGWVNRIIGILGSYSFGMDNSWLYVDQKDKQILDESMIKFKLTDRIRSNSNEAKLYVQLRRAISGYVPVIRTPFDSLETYAESSFRRLFISFLIGLRRLHGSSITEDEIGQISQLMGDGENRLREYFVADKVSAEAISAFKDSVFSEFPEFYRNSRISGTVERPQYPFVQDESDIVSLQENLKALWDHSIAITGPAPWKDAKKKVDEPDSQSAMSDDLPDLTTDDMPGASTDDEGKESGGADPEENESGDGGATDDDNQSGTKSDQDDETSTPENKNDDSESTTEDESASRSKISMHPVPDPDNVSDKEGVKLELTSSETTDTVFYRMELKSYLDGIISDPPKTISQQKLQVLRRIEAFWLNILTPQCIYDLINSVIKLPEMFKIHKAKHK